MAPRFSSLSRQESLERLEASPIDLIVIGGGITGAGAAWEAALRGLRVVLLERNDFGSGTSSKSSKLLHGGFRYLEHGEFSLVFEALSQRNRLFADAPHLASKLDFLFPVFQGGFDKGFMINAGMWAYDVLSAISDFKGTRWHRKLDPAMVADQEPAVRKSGLRAAYSYTDGLTEDARLVIETIKSAIAAGAICLHYTEVKGFLRDETGRITGVEAFDRLSDRPVRLQARRVLNAAGPWADALARLDDPQAPRRLRPTKGVHILTRAFVTDHAVVVRSAKAGEKVPRVLFVIPYGGRTLIGTTDTDHDGPPDDFSYLDRELQASPEEVAYLLAAANASFDVQLTPDDVISTYAGWRPLIAPAEAGLSESETSREHEVFVAPSGLVTIAGGKLTAYRAMGRQAIQAVVDSWGREVGRPTTRPSAIEHCALSGSELDGMTFEGYVGRALLERGALEPALVANLVRRYGTNWPALKALLQSDPALGSPLPGLVSETPFFKVEIVYAAEYEGAVSVCDFLMRRTRLHLLDADQALGTLEVVATLLGRTLQRMHGWDEERFERWKAEQCALYRGEVEKNRAARGFEETLPRSSAS